MDRATMPPWRDRVPRMSPWQPQRSDSVAPIDDFHDNIDVDARIYAPFRPNSYRLLGSRYLSCGVGVGLAATEILRLPRGRLPPHAEGTLPNKAAPGIKRG